MADSIRSGIFFLLGHADVASAAGVALDKWRRHHLLDFVGEQAIGPSNSGRLPYVVVQSADETYQHETAAPRGGTRRAIVNLTFCVSGFGSRIAEAHARLAAIVDAACSVIREDDAYVIGDETRFPAERRPYGWSQAVTVVVETSFGPDYDC